MKAPHRGYAATGAVVASGSVAGDHQQVRLAAAAQPATPPKTLRSLLNDPDDDVLINLAFNASTPADVIDALARRRGGHPQIRRAAGLAADLHVDVRKAVTHNPVCPQSVLESLVQDSHPVAGWAAEATIRRTPDELDVEAVFSLRHGVARSVPGWDVPSLPAASLQDKSRNRGLCGRVVASTGLCCLLVSDHRGNCRSVLS